MTSNSKLTLLLEKQYEGGFTILCRELPELITECDSMSDMMDNVMDALGAVIDLYKRQRRELPKFTNEDGEIEFEIMFRYLK